MLDELKKQFTSAKILITFLIIAVGIYLLQIIWQFLSNFSDVFAVLISAWLLSFILEPLVEYLMRWSKLKKMFAALIVYAAFLVLIGIAVFSLVPALVVQTQHVLSLLPEFLAPYPSFITKWGDLISSYLNNAIVLLPSVANFFFSVFIAVIISFYFVIDKQRINEELYRLIPKKWHKETKYVQELINTTFASFLRVQLVFGLLAWIVTWIILTIFRIDFAASTSFMSGILTLVPLLGPVLGIIPPIIVTLVVNNNQILFVFIALFVAQQIIFNVIGPKLLGKAFKIHPVIILLSFVVGYKIAGGTGAIFAVPVLSIFVVLIHRLSSHFINPEGKD